MIKFFRKIRQKLLSENKFSKYLIYAFGEIILVVIGILIALQINNWNQKRMNHILGESYLKRLHNELIQDTLHLNSSFTVTDNGIKKITLELQKAYKAKNSKEDINNLLRLQNFTSDALIISKATYEDLLNTQNFNIIPNDSLRFLIVDYYRNTEQAARDIDNFNQLTNDMQIKYFETIPIAKYYPWIIWNFSEEQLNYKEDFKFINDPTSHEFKLMETMQLLFWSKHRYLIHHYSDLKVQATEIINLINQELTKNK